MVPQAGGEGTWEAAPGSSEKRKGNPFLSYQWVRSEGPGSNRAAFFPHRDSLSQVPDAFEGDSVQASIRKTFQKGIILPVRQESFLRSNCFGAPAPPGVTNLVPTLHHPQGGAERPRTL